MHKELKHKVVEFLMGGRSRHKYTVVAEVAVEGEPTILNKRVYELLSERGAILSNVQLVKGVLFEWIFD